MLLLQRRLWLDDATMKPNRILIALAGTLLWSFALADAFDKQVASITLLQNRKIQDDMKITEAQRQKMNQNAAPFNKTVQDLSKKANGKPPTEADQKKIYEALAKMKTAIMSSLTDAQAKRLREISLQAIGVGALGDDTVAKRLGISDNVKAKIRAELTAGLQKAGKVQQDVLAKAQEGIKEPKTEAEKKKAQETFNARLKQYEPEATKKINAIRAESEKKVLAMLSAQQRATWKALLGKPFVS